jgi:hypothetical protein
MEAPPKSELVALRENGKTRDEIAAFYGVSLQRVKRWIKHYEIASSVEPRKSHIRARNKSEQRRALGEEDGLTLIEKARVILGKRMSEDFRGYLLDGRPVRIDVLLKSAGLTIPDVP